MNLNKSNYILWLVIIITCICLGMIYFSFDFNLNHSEPQTSEQTTEISPKEARINEIKNSLTLDQKIGQMILAKVPETNIMEDIQNYNLGGYIIFSKDVANENSETFNEKVSQWQNVSIIPMIIASDEEGGTVTRVSSILPKTFLSPGEIYNTGGLELIHNEELEKAQLLKSIGINTNLGPVADVSLSPNSFIYDRTLQLNPELSLEQAAETTSEFVTTTVEAFKSVQEGCCLKHFPGYGDNGDSHSQIIIDQQPLEVLQNIYYIPFQAGINAGVGSILISHNIYNALDPNEPASLSPAVHSVLRDELNFQGVILTDDLDMEALSNFTDKSNAAVVTINAGTDMIICSNYQSIIPRIKAELENGGITQQRFDDALNHVLGWKYDLGLI